MSDFKTQREIYEHLVSGGKVKADINGEIVSFDSSGILTNQKYFHIPGDWQKYTEHKKLKVIKLYRYTCVDSSGWIYQTNWINGKPSDTLLKTEEKEIEVEG